MIFYQIIRKMEKEHDRPQQQNRSKREEVENPYNVEEKQKDEGVTEDESERREKQVSWIQAKISVLKSKIANKDYKLVEQDNLPIQQEPLSEKQQKKLQKEGKKKLQQEKKQQQEKLKQLKSIAKEEKKQQREEKKNQKKEEKEQRKSKLQKPSQIKQSISIIKQNQELDSECPEYLLCPITQTKMQSPYLLSVCGHTFEEQVIRQWLSKQQKCPLCNKSAQVDHLVKNYALAEAVSTIK